MVISEIGPQPQSCPEPPPAVIQAISTADSACFQDLRRPAENQAIIPESTEVAVVPIGDCLPAEVVLKGEIAEAATAIPRLGASATDSGESYREGVATRWHEGWHGKPTDPPIVEPSTGDPCLSTGLIAYPLAFFGCFTLAEFYRRRA